MRLRYDPNTGRIDVQTEREQKKYEFDTRTRVLIGARLTRKEVERYREAAAAEGKSLYAWVRDTLRAAVM